MPGKSSSNPDGVPAKYASLSHRLADKALSIRDADADLLRDTIDAVVADGDGIMLSRTSDGGAVSISVYSGGRRATAYATSLDELHDTLVQLKQATSN